MGIIYLEGLVQGYWGTSACVFSLTAVKRIPCFQPVSVKSGLRVRTSGKILVAG
jgi:hypothetical protein